MQWQPLYITKLMAHIRQADAPHFLQATLRTISLGLFLKDLIMVIHQTQNWYNILFCPRGWILETEELFQQIPKIIDRTKLALYTVTVKVIHIKYSSDIPTKIWDLSVFMTHEEFNCRIFKCIQHCFLLC